MQEPWTTLFSAAGALSVSLGAAALRAALPAAFVPGGGESVVFGAVRFSLGPPLFVLAAVAVVVVLFVASLFLSKRFYARREF